MQWRPSSWRTRLAIVLVMLGAGLAHAQPGCDRSPVTWACFGVFELRFTTPQGGSLVRLTHFSNGETLAEMASPGGSSKRLLTVPPGNLSLAFGLAPDESLQAGARNPFMFMDMAFAYPAMALQVAYPAGPAAVPAAGMDVPVTIDGKTPVVVRVARRADGQVAFHLKLAHQGSTQEMDGVWVARLAEPWPDDFPVGDWRFGDDARFSTLGQARGVARARRVP